MWSIATGVSWHAEQAATIGDFTSVVGSASHGAEVEHVLAATPVHGAALVHVHGAAAVQLVPPCLPEVTPVTVHGLARLHVHGVAGVQLWVPCVPVRPSGSVVVRLVVANPSP